MPTKHISIKKPLSVSLSKGYFQNPCGNVKRDKKGISKRMLCMPINMHFKFKLQAQHTRKMEKERERLHQKRGMLSSFDKNPSRWNIIFIPRIKRGGGGKLYPRHVMYRSFPSFHPQVPTYGWEKFKRDQRASLLPFPTKHAPYSNFFFSKYPYRRMLGRRRPSS